MSGLREVVVPLVRDEQGEAYRRVRDATFCNENITSAEKIGILELVKFEILRNLQSQLDE